MDVQIEESFDFLGVGLFPTHSFLPIFRLQTALLQLWPVLDEEPMVGVNVTQLTLNVAVDKLLNNLGLGQEEGQGYLVSFTFEDRESFEGFLAQNGDDFCDGLAALLDRFLDREGEVFQLFRSQVIKHDVWSEESRLGTTSTDDLVFDVRLYICWESYLIQFLTYGSIKHFKEVSAPGQRSFSCGKLHRPSSIHVVLELSAELHY